MKAQTYRFFWKWQRIYVGWGHNVGIQIVGTPHCDVPTNIKKSPFGEEEALESLLGAVEPQRISERC